MTSFYEIFEEPVLHQPLKCDDLLMLTPEPQSWNSCDSSLVSPVVSPKSCDLLLGVNPSSVSGVNVKPLIPLENLLQDHSVKVQRLNRKAKLARENRKRKNCRLQELEVECQELREEVKKLRQRERDIALKSQTSDASISAEKLSHETVLRQQLHDIALRIANSSSAEDKTELHSAIFTLEEYLNQRGQSSLAQVRACLDAEFKKPYKGPEQFLFWVLSRNDPEFFQDPSGMWKSLFSKHLEIDEDKLKELEELGKSAQDLRQSCLKVYEHFEELSKAFKMFYTHGHTIVSKTLNILSPEQIARFIKWVADNQICVNELVLR